MSAADTQLLVQWIERRDAEAFRTLVSRHASMVYATCRRILDNATEAEDAAQECFESLSRLPEWPKGPFGAWLHRVATNHALNRLKSDSRRKAREERYAHELGDRTEVRWDDLYHYVDEAIAELPEEFREPLVACFLEGQSHAAIATASGVPRRTVSYRVEKGIERVRQNLKERGVLVAAVSLTALLEANALETAPQTLVATLGRIALAGTRGLSPGPLVANRSTVFKAVLAKGKTLLWYRLAAGLLLLSTAGVVCLWPNREQTEVSVAKATPPKPRPQAEAQKNSYTPEAFAQAIATVLVRGKRGGSEGTSGTSATSGTTATIRGTVVNDRAYPVEGATVRLEISNHGLGYEIRGIHETRTQKDGTFKIPGVSASGHARTYVDKEGYLQAVSPGRPLEPGRTYRDFDSILRKARYAVSGRVVDSQQRPVPGAEIGLRHFELRWPQRGSYFDGRAKMRSTFSDRNGRFRMAIPEYATCDFTVTSPGYGTGFFKGIDATMALLQRFGVGTDEVLFVLQEPGAIAGHVRKADGTPMVGALVRTHGGAALYGQAEDAAPAQTSPVETRTDSEGAYLLTGLGADYDYEVSVERSAKPAWGAASRRNIHVAPGQTTENVDLLAEDLGTIHLHGRVTDQGSGGPAHPVSVIAKVTQSDGNSAGDKDNMVTTAEDGRYTLPLQVAKAVDLRVTWRYTDGAHVFPKNNCSGSTPSHSPDQLDGDVTVFKSIQPGQEELLDFAVPGPITIPVLCCDSTGIPLSGVELGPRQEGFAWGSALVTGADGRAVYRGLGPNTEFRLQAYVNAPERMMIGESAPFSGAPGQTIPEVVITCRPQGGIEGVVVDAEGRPVADTEIGCAAVLQDGTVVPPSSAFSNDDGSFVIMYGIPHDRYKGIAVGFIRDDQIVYGLMEDVEVLPDRITALGTVTCGMAMPVQEAQRLAEAQQATP